MRPPIGHGPLHNATLFTVVAQFARLVLALAALLFTAVSATFLIDTGHQYVAVAVMLAGAAISVVIAPIYPRRRQ